MISEIFDYEKVRDKILCRCVSSEKSRKLPEDVVCTSCLDFGVICCVFEETEKKGRVWIPVSWEMMAAWGISLEQLLEDSRENTAKKYRYIFRDLSAVTEAISWDTQHFLDDPAGLIESVPELSAPSENLRVFTLINQEMHNGSVILLFPDLLAPFAEQAEADLIILPSSVNELICIAGTGDLDYGRLREIVRSVNLVCVTEDEKLSDNIYIYSREKNSLEVLE